MLHDLLLIAGGFLGGGGTAFINNWFHRSKDQADAAKVLSDVAVVVGNLNVKLNGEIRDLKRVVAILTDTIDEIIPAIQGLSPEQMKRLKETNAAAKLAI